MKLIDITVSVEPQIKAGIDCIAKEQGKTESCLIQELIIYALGRIYNVDVKDNYRLTEYHRWIDNRHVIDTLRDTYSIQPDIIPHLTEDDVYSIMKRYGKCKAKPGRGRTLIERWAEYHALVDIISERITNECSNNRVPTDREIA